MHHQYTSTGEPTTLCWGNMVNLDVISDDHGVSSIVVVEGSQETIQFPLVLDIT